MTAPVGSVGRVAVIPVATPIAPERASRFAAASMGSPLRLTVGGSPENRFVARAWHAAAARAWAATQAEFAAADAAMSRFSATSELTRLNRTSGSGRSVQVGRRLERAIAAADRARRITGGRFEPRVVDDLEALGEHGADLDGAVTVADRRRAWRTEPIACRLRPGVLAINRPIDLGGIGKGLALRWSARGIEQAGVSDYLLDAGGDIVLRGVAPEDAAWQVGIEDPSGAASPLAVIAPPDGAVATSSVRRRSWTIGDRRVHHLLDPVTGQPAEGGLQAVTVAGLDPAWAEVWSKTLFIAGRRAIAAEARARGLAAWWVADDGSLEMTPAARPMTVWVAGELD